MTSRAHFDRLARLLSLESEAQAQQILERTRRFRGNEAERSGYALVGLRINDVYGGLGGRILISLNKPRQVPLPWTTLAPGSPVLLSAGGAGHASTLAIRGIVSEKTERLVTIATDELPEGLDDEIDYRLDVAPDETVRRRQVAALDAARTARTDDKDPRVRRFAQLRDVLIGASQPSFAVHAPPETWFTYLNEAQRDAVSHALTAQDLAIIHGPPGTGKTTAVVELIRQAVVKGDKVLACAPSNLAVDNMLERLVVAGVNVVRVGHPARVLPALRDHTLDLLVEEHDDFKLARKLVREAQKLFQQADRWTRAKPQPGEKAALRREARQLLADARRFEAQAVARLLDGAEVVCATTTAVDRNILGDRTFDLVVLDEACQATEPSCWIPLLRSSRVVLAGDHCQLPPTIVSREAAAQGFDISLMERLVELYGERVTRRLDEQYRMHADIMGFSSQEFYGNSLTAHPAVAQHLLKDLPHIEASSPTAAAALEFIDTAGAGFNDETEEDGESRINRREADFVTTKVRELLAIGLQPATIAVISPYAGQVRLLRHLLNGTEVEIDTIDGFQGREKEAVVISCVRSNYENDIGFLSELRRMNVALTRARRKLIVVGDSATLATLPFYQRLQAWFETRDAYTSVWSLMSIP